MEEQKSSVYEVDERSEPVREILGSVPSWTVRWGTTVIFFGIFVLLILSYLIKYPDVIQARVVVTTPTPPASIVARSQGRIQSLWVKDAQKVKEGEVLAVIDNPARPEDVQALKGKIDSLQIALMSPFSDPAISFPENYRLGEAQKEYASFVRNYRIRKFFMELDPVSQELAAINRQIDAYHNLKRNQNSEKSTLQEEIDLLEKEVERNRTLLDKGAISRQEFENKQKELLKSQRSYKQTESSLSETGIELSRLSESMTRLTLDGRERIANLNISLDESIKNLEGAIDSWEERFLLKAPFDGSVTLYKFWSEDQFVREGEEVMIVVPAQEDKLVGKVSMPTTNSGKVKPGQAVKISLDNYPRQEFGIVNGTVKKISSVPRDNSYLIEVEFPQGLLSTYKKKLSFRQEMQGSAEIITEDLRLIQRIFYQFRDLFMGS